jgi:hypothetical protein
VVDSTVVDSTVGNTVVGNTVVGNTVVGDTVVGNGHQASSQPEVGRWRAGQRAACGLASGLPV